MSEISFYIDGLTVEALDTSLVKQAGLMDTIKNAITSYFNAHYDPEDKVGTLLNFLAPGAVSILIGGWLGPTFGLAMRVLDIDVASILRNIYNEIKSLLSDNKQITSGQIDNIVNTTIQSQTGEIVKTTNLQQLEDAKFLKLAMVSLSVDPTIKLAYSRKSKTVGILGKLLSWIIKVAVSSAGLMVAGDAVNKLLGRPNAFDGTLQHGKPVEAPAVPVIRNSTQTKFSLNPSYSDTKQNNWSENYPNNKNGVENMLINFAKEVYQGLNGLESSIRSVPGFQTTVDEILFFNRGAAGDNVVYLPKFFTSKKQLVDHWIDQVAAKV